MKKRSGVELKKSFDFRKIILPLYVVGFLIYLAIGLLPAGASDYVVATRLEIPLVNLTSDVTELKLEHGELKTPDTIVGSFTRAKNKTLLIGHAGTVFSELRNLHIGDEIIYKSMIYKVESMITQEKSMISMREILAAEDEDTLILMTCAGEPLDNNDATHRLIVTARVE
ncbi:sortase [Candidatus Saccharibacteria bacterium]|nr:sortase [Candidatus Saccharibacteria bacterium]MBQ1540203.1 sortase [Candidatus Saccharibacteria bacterium]